MGFDLSSKGFEGIGGLGLSVEVARLRVLGFGSII